MRSDPQPTTTKALLARTLAVTAGALICAGCTDNIPEPRAAAEGDNPYPAGAETPTFFSGSQWTPFERRDAAAK